MRLNTIEMRLLVKGKPITEYPHFGQIFVEGRHGSAFEIEVVNHGSTRVEAVVSVDGLSVTDGKEAGPQSGGYLVEAHASMRIPGWRLNGAEAAAFEFVTKQASYAASKVGGSTRNTGVIGVMAFAEKPTYRAPAYHARPFGAGSSTINIAATRSTGLYGSGMVFGTASMSVPVMGSTASLSHAVPETAYTSAVSPTVGMNALGTGFGQAQDFATTEATFDRGDMVAMMVCYYDDARALRARGIVLDRRSKVRATQTPNAFPGLATGCEPPPGWRR